MSTATDLILTVTIPAAMVDRHLTVARSILGSSYTGTTPIQDALKLNIHGVLESYETEVAVQTSQAQQSAKTQSDLAANPVIIV